MNMELFLSVFVYAFASLFSIVNPIGMSAVFLSLTKHVPDERRHQMAYLIAIYGAILLIVTFLIGPYILYFFGISLPSIQVAGGILVFSSAWSMLRVKNKPELSTEIKNSAEDDKVFFPLTMPLTAGAGSIAVTIELATRYTKHHVYTIQNTSACLLAIIVVFLAVAICYRYANNLFARLGKTGSNVVSSLTAFILLAISVTVIWDGILGFIEPLLRQSA
jgi:multiple antibiotic resistance protein